MREVLLGAVAPAAVSACVWTVLSRVAGSSAPADSDTQSGSAGDGPAEPSNVVSRQAGAIAVGCGGLLACALLKLTPLQPTSHWHWLPYLLLLAMSLGPIADADGVSWLERVALFGATAIIGALALAPTWESVTPSRPTQIAIWAAAVTVASIAVSVLGRRANAAVFAVCLAVSASGGAAVLVLSGNMRLAQELGAIAAAIGGLAAATGIQRSRGKLHGLALPATVMIFGCLWTGQVNSFSSVPFYCYVLPAVAPLAAFPRANLGKIAAVASVVAAGVGIAAAYG